MSNRSEPKGSEGITALTIGARICPCARLDSIGWVNRVAKRAIGRTLLIASMLMLGACSERSAPALESEAGATGSPGAREGTSRNSGRAAARDLPAADPWGVPIDPADRCSKWSLDGLRLGMTITDAHSTHPDLHRDPGRDGQGVGGTHYDWQVPGEDGVENVVLADGNEGTSLVVSYSLDLTRSVASLDDLRARLTERWGSATEPQGMERMLIVAKWLDAACDVEAQLRSIARRSDPRDPARFVVVLTSLAARGQLIDRKETELEKREQEQPW